MNKKKIGQKWTQCGMCKSKVPEGNFCDQCGNKLGIANNVINKILD